MPVVRWTQEQIDLMLSLSKEKVPDSKIAARIGKSREAVTHKRRALGVRKAKHFDETTFDAIKRGFDEGMSDEALARVFKTTWRYIQRIRCNHKWFRPMGHAGLSADKQEYIRAHYGKVPTKEIADHLGVTPRQVWYYGSNWYGKNKNT